MAREDEMPVGPGVTFSPCVFRFPVRMCGLELRQSHTLLRRIEFAAETSREEPAFGTVIAVRPLTGMPSDSSRLLPGAAWKLERLGELTVPPPSRHAVRKLEAARLTLDPSRLTEEQTVTLRDAVLVRATLELEVSFQDECGDAEEEYLGTFQVELDVDVVEG